MPRPKNPELEASRIEFDKLKPLPRLYGVRVNDHYPEIDIYRLGQAVAGRVVYPEGLLALRQIKALYGSKQKAQSLQPVAA
ncbi:MAG: hypothetical protein ACRYFX_18505 [Janthinobacterium lividum]